MSTEKEIGEKKGDLVLETLGSVGAKLGHDFNNLFAAIQGCSELIKFKLSKLPSGNPCERQLYLIESSIAKGVTMTNQMRSWIRHEPLPKHHLPLAPLLSSVAAFLDSSKLFTVAVDVVILSPCSVSASEFHVKHALMALCTNAIDAMSSLKDRVMVLLLDEVDGCARISVVDHGIGIAKESRDLLLQPLHSSKPRKVGEGLGLNLAMINELMKRLDGELAIRSAPGIGSVFSLVFPIAKPESSA